MFRLLSRTSLGRTSSTYPSLLTRAASTSSRLPRGLSEVLEKRPDDVVITFAKRTAIGRAKKGQFKDTPPDEILYALLKVYRLVNVYCHKNAEGLLDLSRLPSKEHSWTQTRLTISALVRVLQISNLNSTLTSLKQQHATLHLHFTSPEQQPSRLVSLTPFLSPL